MHRVLPLLQLVAAYAATAKTQISVQQKAAPFQERLYSCNRSAVRKILMAKAGSEYLQRQLSQIANQYRLAAKMYLIGRLQLVEYQSDRLAAGAG